MEKHIKKLQNGLMLLLVYSLLITLALIVIYFKVENSTFDHNQDLIRTKGIVIEDREGKERILIGAPIPTVNNRIRTDTSEVRELWAHKFPKNYMELYQNYNHETNGILFLDKNGHDRMAIGDPVPDLYFGKRIGPATGIIINDEKGQERTGYGVLNVNGKNRVNLGLDNANGTEGMMLTLNDDGTTGLAIRDLDQTIFLGKADTSNWYTFGDYPFNGLIIKDSTGVKYNLNSWNKN